MKHLSVFSWSKLRSLQVATQSPAEGRRKRRTFGKCLQSDVREKNAAVLPSERSHIEGTLKSPEFLCDDFKNNKGRLVELSPHPALIRLNSTHSLMEAW